MSHQLSTKHKKGGFASRSSEDSPPPYSQFEKEPVSTSPKSSGPSRFLRGLKSLRSMFTPQVKDLEGALQQLAEYDIVIIMDDSGSMLLGDRWQQAMNALADLLTMVTKFDSDGVDIHFLNARENGAPLQRNVKNGENVRRLFSLVWPTTATPIGERLDAILDDYLTKVEQARFTEASAKIKPINVIVITDGIPTDTGDMVPEKVIVRAAERLDRGWFPESQVGIQFVQVGTDKGAHKYLKDLDDNLVRWCSDGRMRDIVDTTPCSTLRDEKLSKKTLLKIILGSINRRVDISGAKAVI